MAVSKLAFGLSYLLALAAILLSLALAVVLQANTNLRHDRTQDQATIATQQAEIATMKAKAGDFVVWNSCGSPCVMNGTEVRAGSAPDTFDVIISFTSTTPITVHFMTLEGWAQYRDCSFKISCVSSQFHDPSVGPTTNLKDYTFTDAEGCASYVIVFQAAGDGVITPDERVHYHPSAVPTGACAA